MRPSDSVNPCPECSGTSLEAFPWRFKYLNWWVRNLFCNYCKSFLIETYGEEPTLYEKTDQYTSN